MERRNVDSSSAVQKQICVEPVLPGLGALEFGGDVPADQGAVGRVGQQLADGDVNVANRLRREAARPVSVAAAKQASVKAVEMTGGDLLELDATEHWEHVKLEVAPVGVPGAVLHLRHHHRQPLVPCKFGQAESMRGDVSLLLQGLHEFAEPALSVSTSPEAAVPLLLPAPPIIATNIDDDVPSNPSFRSCPVALSCGYDPASLGSSILA